MPPRSPGSYRDLAEVPPEPMSEDEAIELLLRRSHAVRHRLLVLTIAVSLLGGVAGVVFYVSTATEIYGRVAGAFFAGGALLVFTAFRRLSSFLARRYEARWIADLAGRHGLDSWSLSEALGMLE